MKNTLKYLSLLFFLVTFVACDKEDSSEDIKDFKIYGVESGIIKYTTTTSGTVASGTVTGSGSAQFYFKKWGAISLGNEEYTNKTVVTIPISNVVVTDIDNIHNTEKTDFEMFYDVDYDASIIYSQETPIVEFMRLYDFDADEAGRQTLISIGGVQLENEEYKGYDCEVWTALASKQWLYKGVVLKITTTLAGITITKEATDIQFDVPVDDSYFKLPDFEITTF